MKITIIFILTLLTSILFASENICDFNKETPNYQFYNGAEFPGAEGNIEVNKNICKLNYDFTKGGNYVALIINIPEKKENISNVEFKIKNVKENTLTVRLKDESNEVFQKGTPNKIDNWQKIIINKKTNWAFSYGGNSNHIFDGNPKEISIIIENNDAKNKKGSVLIEDVNINYGSNEEDINSYVITNSLNFWNTYYEPNQRPATKNNDKVAVKANDRLVYNNNVILYGRPNKISFDIENNTPNAILVLRLGSQAQSFQKQVATLTGKTDHIEVDIANLESWDHFGGNNDGIVTYPLRLLDISIYSFVDGEVKISPVKIETILGSSPKVVLKSKTISENNNIIGFPCEVTNIDKTKKNGELVYTIRDYSGKELFSKKENIQILPNTEGQTYSINYKNNNNKYLNCEFAYIENEKVINRTTKSYTDKNLPNKKATFMPESIFSAGLYLARYNVTEASKIAELGKNAGVKWTREEFSWGRIEPERGKYDWEFYDKIVDISQKNGISTYGLITYWNYWTNEYTEEGIKDYANYCKNLVTHYKDKIKYWEVWNEPNIAFWTGPKPMYAKLLIEAYKAIKEADPSATVIGCSTAGIDTGFIKMVMDNKGPFDALGIHPYRIALNEDIFIKELKDTQKLAESYTKGNKKALWLTEMGWSTQTPNGVTEEEQASLLAKAYMCAKISKVARNISLYDFVNDGYDTTYNENNFGIIYRDLNAKPAYRALSSVCNNLEDKNVVEKINLRNDLTIYKFSNKKEDCISIWSNSSQLLSLQITGKIKNITNLMGDNIPKDSPLSLIKGSPIFITGTNLKVSNPKNVINITEDYTSNEKEEIITLNTDKEIKITKIPNLFKVKKLKPKKYQIIVPINYNKKSEKIQLEINKNIFMYDLQLERGTLTI